MTGISYENLKEELNFFSGSLSTAVRTTSFGVIGAIWAIFTADGIALGLVGAFEIPTLLLVKLAFIFAAGALMTDILQYAVGYWMTSIGVDRWDKAETENQTFEFFYNANVLGTFGMFLYWVGFVLFPCKIVLAILSAVTFFLLAFSVTIK